MRSPTIAYALPTLPRDALAELLDRLELSPDALLADLLALGAAASEVLWAAAEHLIDHSPDTELRQVLPGLEMVPNGPLPLQALSVRPANGLRRGRLSTWKDLAVRTPAELLGLPAIGRKSVAEILELAINHAAVQLLRDDDELSVADVLNARVDEPEVIEPEGSELEEQVSSAVVALPGLETVARWAIAVGGASTLGEALDLAGSTTVPLEVAEALDALRDAPLRSVAPHASTVRAAYDLLWMRCGDERQQEILRRRLMFDGPTLDEIGEDFCLTRERVRQLQKSAEDNLRTALSEPACAEIRWRVAELRESLGTAIPWSGEPTRDALAKASKGLAKSERATAEVVLTWLAGPYRLDRQSDWIFAESEYLLGRVGPRSALGPPPQESVVAAVTSEEGVVDLEEVRRLAAGAGLVPAAAEAWIATGPFREFNGTLMRWQGNVGDKAEVLLALLDRPATADELNDMIGEGHSIRGLRNRLVDEERFVRTDRRRVGLRRWGLEEYTGIVDEIEEEIERRGGEADVDDLVCTVTEQFGLRVGSVISYMTVPRFVTDRGRIRIRRVDEPYVPRRTLFDEAGAYLVDDDRCNYRLRVDGDVLRGSGRRLPAGIGAWLGVLPGVRRQFRFPDGDRLLVSWPESALFGPAVGSLRRQAIALRAHDGDYLLLGFDRANDEVQPHLIRRGELDSAQGWRRGSLLTGLDAADEMQFDQALAIALGAASAAELRRRCRDRGEDELAELVLLEASSELDDALERLKDLLM